LFEKLTGVEQYLFDLLALGLVLFYAYSAVLEPAPTQFHRGIYVLITYSLVFLTYRTPGRLGRVLDYLLILASIVCIGYWIANFEVINYRAGAETVLDKAIAAVGVLLGIELARRVVGSVFVVIGAVMLLYGVYGAYAPELISHAGDTFPDLCTSIFYKSDGVFGIMANVLATYIILFVIFGAFLEASGTQRFFGAGGFIMAELTGIPYAQIIRLLAWLFLCPGAHYLHPASWSAISGWRPGSTPPCLISCSACSPSTGWRPAWAERWDPRRPRPSLPRSARLHTGFPPLCLPCSARGRQPGYKRRSRRTCRSSTACSSPPFCSIGGTPKGRTSSRKCTDS